MSIELILTIDQGTTNTKALLVDREGRAVFRASESVELLHPAAGLVEQDAVALWESVKSVARAGAAHALALGARVAGIALSNQRETAVTWRRGVDGGSEVVGRAISWQCRRSAEICERLREHAGLIRERSGLPLDPLISAGKWAWVLEHDPEERKAAENRRLCFGTVDSWLVYQLTGGRVHATDHTNASRTGLFNLQTLDWDDELLQLFGLPRTALPEVRTSAGDYGVCEAIEELAGIPLVAAIGDSHAAMVGHGSYGAGTVKATYGTGSSLMTLTPRLLPESAVLARTIAWSRGADVQYAIEGNISMTGSGVQWVGEFLGLVNPAADAAKLAATVPDAAGVMFVPAMVGLGAPYWDTAARGAVVNLERSHRAAHLARAAVDAIAYQVADVFEVMEAMAGVPVLALYADGGATRNTALMQFQADVIGRPVLRSAAEELSAIGSALLGGMSLGWWNDFSELAMLRNEVERFEPVMDEAERQRMRHAWSLAVRRVRLTEVEANQ